MADIKMPPDDLEITKDNFDEYFLDVRRHKPEKGQILAKYTAWAELGDGFMKRNIIELLKKPDKALPATQVVRKLALASEFDSYRLCREICEDLLVGLTDDEIAGKSHEFKLEAFYYTLREIVPKDDPHWTVIDILPYSTEDFEFEEEVNGVVIKSKIYKAPPENEPEANI